MYPVKNNEVCDMRFLAVLAIVLLSGCSLFSKGSPDDLVCPQVGFIRHADKVSLPEAEVLINGFSGVCSFKKSSGQVTLDLTIPFIGHRKTAGDAQKIEVSYFIALLNSDEEVLQRQTFSTKVAFEKGTGNGASSEENTIRIPVTSPAAGANYKIIIGFPLTPEQLKYNQDNLHHDKDTK